ncbi:hypothetical protein ABH942_002782 [Flavobacterium sp. 28YEA47A]|uniref:DUF4349 domain-containing protein n=1 Tax=Flavobacterium sp. 28YEA47A TaxID=3156276 RepID=UPI003517969C
MKRAIYLLLVSVCFFSCKQREMPEAYSEDAKAETTASADAAMVSSSAAVVDKNSTRKFIRTADLRFKVKNVAKSTYAIENTVAKFGGFVTSTELRSNIVNTSTAKISNDSLVETTRFVVENNMIIRVPNTLLDTTLKTIARQIDYLDFRVIKADDVSLQLLSNDLSQKRNQDNQKRVEDAITNRGKKLGETLDAEDRLHDSQTQSDEAKLSNLSLKDQVNFSTLSLSLYQREEFKKEVIANPDNEEYRTSMGVRIMDGLKTGWHILEEIIIFFVNIWTIIVAGIIIWILIRRRKKKTNP